MYIFAYAMLLVAFLCALGGAAIIIVQIMRGHSSALFVVEKAQVVMTAALVLASALLLHALYWHDFSVQYVAHYTDRILPVFYRLTAFWAGQPGSLLFWALSVAVCGTLFSFTHAYKNLTQQTRLWFWLFFLAVMAFFVFLLTTWSNPFVLQNPAPADGRGLNPLLQNPGMIFHPPLLFWGYGGFVIPGCLALAQCLSGQACGENTETSWIKVARPFTLLAWLFLTAGIVLGAWWAYMELGWGGYWAWDPVENASLIPWLVGTAAIHTMIIEERRKKLARVNVFLISLTTVSAFFATYLVRSGVIDSVHAFGDGGVGTPLLVFVVFSVFLCAFVAYLGQQRQKALAGIDSREGFIVLTAWVLLLLAVIICIGTLYPIISKIWTPVAQGLDAGFYNRVCLPLFALLAFIVAFCPWLGWNGGVRDKKRLGIVGAVLVFTCVIVWFAGYRQPTAFVATGSAVAALVTVALLWADKNVRTQRNTVAAFGVHLGMLLMVLGVAFSGPYKTEADLILQKGSTGTVGAYEVTLVDITNGAQPGYDYLEARLQVVKDNVLVGLIAPQRRIYHKFGEQQFSEVDTVFSLGDEIYASLLGIDRQAQIMVSVSVNPLVNWIWIGGALMCLFPFLALGGRRRP